MPTREFRRRVRRRPARTPNREKAVVSGRKALSWLVRTGISCAWMVLPSDARPVVYGGPQVDVNATATLSALLRAGHPPPVLLAHDVPATRRRLAASEGDDFASVEVVQLYGLRGLTKVARARVFLFTHYVFRGPRPHGRRLVVNLWHGDGPKSPRPEHEKAGPAASHYLVSNNRTWGENHAAAFRIPVERLWVIGSPRTDDMLRPTGDAALVELGLDPRAPIVLWAPTFRMAEHAGVRGWADSGNTDPFREFLDAPDLPAAENGGTVQLVVKPHPFDPTDFRASGLPVLTDDDLIGVGTNLYRLLARCSALITDYSSIWTDYMALDRPVVLYCPDLLEYSQGRGLAGVSLEEVAPGPLVESADDLREVLALLAGRADVGRERRHAACRTLGIVTTFGAGDRLMQHLRSTAPGPAAARLAHAPERSSVPGGHRS